MIAAKPSQFRTGGRELVKAIFGLVVFSGVVLILLFGVYLFVGAVFGIAGT